jgi:V/A-type H+-transporting ATPase subunit A
MRSDTMKLLQEEAELKEIVQLVGQDALSFQDQFKLEVCKSIREDYLHQNAFHEIDTYSSTNKQYRLLKLILEYYRQGSIAIENCANYKSLISLPVREAIGRFKYVEEDEVNASFETILEKMSDDIQYLTKKEEN